MIVVRKLLDHVFSKKELQVLDDILPDFKRHDRLDDEEALQKVKKTIFKTGWRKLCFHSIIYNFLIIFSFQD